MESTIPTNKDNEILSLANNLRWDLGVNFHDTIIESIYEDASHLAKRSVHQEGDPAKHFDLKIDRIVTRD